MVYAGAFLAVIAFIYVFFSKPKKKGSIDTIKNVRWLTR